MEEYSIHNVDFGVGEGHEQSYPRPAIVFKIINELGMCIVIPLTSNMNHLSLPYTVQINKTGYTNLREDSVALVFQIRAIDKARMTGSRIGKAEEYQVNKIKNVMKEMLAID
jgi:mRNA-degrading endonuclease toxin of MazEF toxin-antitoxin module